jgi:hypothetical protein
VGAGAGLGVVGGPGWASARLVVPRRRTGARRLLRAGARATRITPPTSATIPAACNASIGGEMRMASPNTTTPSRMPTTGSAAVIAGSEACSGAALNEFSISHTAASAATARL